MPKSFSFPEWLKGSPADQEAEQQRQDLLRASFTRAHLTEAERLVGRGRLLEQTARANLKSVKRGDKEAREVHNAQLADALATQGNYSDAANIHPDKVRRKHFRDIKKAIEKPDEEKCSCPDSKFDSEELLLTPRFERERIFSPVHGEVVSVVECRKCGHKNARLLRSRLLKNNDALAQAEAMKRQVFSDAQILNATA